MRNYSIYKSALGLSRVRLSTALAGRTHHPSRACLLQVATVSYEAHDGTACMDKNDAHVRGRAYVRRGASMPHSYAGTDVDATSGSAQVPCSYPHHTAGTSSRPRMPRWRVHSSTGLDRAHAGGAHPAPDELTQDDRASASGIFELDTDTPTSGSETDEPWPPKADFPRESARTRAGARRASAARRPLPHGVPSYRVPRQRPTSGSWNPSSTLFAPPSRSRNTVPSFSSPLAMAPMLPEEVESAQPSPTTPAPAQPFADGAGTAPRGASSWMRRTSPSLLAHTRDAQGTPPNMMGPSHTTSSFLSPRHAVHRRTHSACAPPPSDAILCGSPVGGPEGIDPGLIAAIRHDTASSPSSSNSASSTRRSLSVAHMRAAPQSPPIDAPYVGSVDSPMGSPRVRRNTIRLQRMPRSVSQASDLVIPPSQSRDARITSPQPSPTGADGVLSRPTLLGLALALPGDMPPLPSTPTSASPPSVSTSMAGAPLIDARILAVSRTYKQRKWRRRVPLMWPGAWPACMNDASPTVGRAAKHCSSVQQSLSKLEMSQRHERLDDGIQVTSSVPALSSLRPPSPIPAPQPVDVFARAPPAARPRPRIVSERVPGRSSRRLQTSVDDLSTTQRGRLWRELVQAKGMCDAELDRTLSGLLRLSDELLHPVDLDATSVDVAEDARMPLAPVERFSAIAADMRSTSLHTLLARPDICTGATASVQALGTLWDAHPEWPGRGWYVGLLLTLAALSRVIEWWNAEHRFWSDDAHTDLLLESATESGIDSPGYTPVGTPGPSDSPALRSSEPTPPPSSILLELTMDLRIQFVSTAWQRIIGTDPSSLVHEPVGAVLAPGNAALLERAQRQLLESPGHTVQVALSMAVAGTPSAHSPISMTAQGMLVYHHGTRDVSHTMWVLHSRQTHEPFAGEMRLGGAVGGLDTEADAIPTDLVQCRICESEIPAWFFAKHSEICHEIHRLELTLGTCNEALWALMEAVTAVRATVEQGHGMYREQPLRAEPRTARPVLDKALAAMHRAMSISTPRLPDVGLSEGTHLLSPPSNEGVLALRSWHLDAPVPDPALVRVCNDVSEAVRDKIYAVKRMCNTIVYVEMVRQESEAYVASLLDQAGGTSVDHDTGNTTLHINDEPVHPPVLIDTPASDVEDTLAGVDQLLLDSVDDASDDDWPRSRHEPVPIPRARTASGTTRAARLATPPLSPYVSSAEGRVGKSPRFGSSVGSAYNAPASPHVLPPAQARTTATSIRDFELLKPISKGAYGSVFLARKRATGDMYAIKILKKADMIAKNQVTNVRAERMILMNRTQSPFVVKLFFTFQSPEYLYLVMEYLPGGDCASLVKMLGALPDEWAQQYLAEIVQGLGYLHSTGVIHRDMKPDNLLIDHHGHLKLTDFGLSKLGLLGRHRPMPHATKHTADADRLHNATWAEPTSGGARPSLPVPFAHVSEAALASPPPVMPDSTSHTETFFSSMSQAHDLKHSRIVGTPDYLAPESILGVGMDDFTVDWWAVGAILFEFLHGYPPFHASTPTDVFERILSRQIEWDEDTPIAPEAYDLINRLLCMDRTQRLGANGVAEIKSHPYFHGIDWDHLTEADGPFVPQLTDVASTDYFDARGAVPQLWQDDEAQGSPSTVATSMPGHSSSSGAATPNNEFGAFSYKNLPVLKQANDEMLRRIRRENGPGLSASPAASISSGGSFPLSTTPSASSIGRRPSTSECPPAARNRSHSHTRAASSVSSRSESRSVQRHILLADANPVSRVVLQTMLASCGAQITIAVDSADLVQMAMSDTLFDTVFIKLGAHSAEAQDGARMIKSTCNVNAHTPIVAVVTGDTPVDAAGSVFDAVLPLPSSPSAISQLLTSLQREPSPTVLDEATPLALAQLAL